MLAAKSVAGRNSLGKDSSTLLADGDNIIAMVHDPHYALLFAHVEEMHELLVAVGTGACDVDYRGLHSKLCRTCAARALLSKLLPLGSNRDWHN
jgi:hypothetical protein